MSPSLARWLKRLKADLFGPSARPARSARLGVESLEDRAVPAVHTWDDGGATNNWSDPGNWDAAGVPTTGEIGGTFVVLPTSDPTMFQNIAGLVVDQIIFTSAGNVLTLNTPLSVGSSASLLTNISATGNNTITGAALNIVGSTVFLRVAAAGTLTIASPITGGAVLFKGDPGTLALTTTTASTYSGATIVADGVLLLNTNTEDAGLGQSPVITVDNGSELGPAVLRLMGAYEIRDTTSIVVGPDGLVDATASGGEDVAALTLNGGRVAIAAGGFFEIQSNGTVSSNGAVGSQITGAGNFNLEGGTVTFDIADGPAATDLLISARIGQVTPAALTKSGAGVLALGGANTYAGTTRIEGGTLLVSGIVPGSVTVAGGTLAGSGTIGAVAVANGSVAPGAGGTTTTLSTGNLVITLVTFRPTIAGPSSDRLNVTGTVTLNQAVLNANVINGNIPAGTIFTLINNDGSDAVVGTFAGLAQGATVTLGGQGFTLSYTGGTGNDVTLTSQTPVPVPAPTSAAPFYSGATVFGTLLVLQGGGVQGGAQVVPLPPGSMAFFADVSGDGKGDVILILGGNIFVLNGDTGAFFLAFFDQNGDGVRELVRF